MDIGGEDKYMWELSRYIYNDLRTELIDLLVSRYGEKEIEEVIGCNISTLKRGSDKAFNELLSNYLDDDELRTLVWLRYTELGCALKNFGISAPVKKCIMMEELDDKSKAILWYLYQKGHANIEELSEAVCASHYEVLSRLKEVIIPKSNKIVGNPIVKFEASEIDPISGEKVLFSWWIMDDDIPVMKNNVELLNGRDRITVIADLPGARLPNQMDVSARYKNGILEIIINKGLDEGGT
ncbi:MAG: hypothetical protein PHN90_00340 [Methanothrix sp.]|nr:hypothetical protein [Methanothrix sp.]